MHTLEHWISQYLLDCQYQKALDPKTIKAYRIDLTQFSTLIDQRNLELTREGIMEYIAELHQQYKPKTIRRKIASVKAFCGYLEYEELVQRNPFSRLRLKLSTPLILPRTIPLTAIGAILTVAYQMQENAKHRGNGIRFCGILRCWSFCLLQESGYPSCVRLNVMMCGWMREKSKSMVRAQKNALFRSQIVTF